MELGKGDQATLKLTPKDKNGQVLTDITAATLTLKLQSANGGITELGVKNMNIDSYGKLVYTITAQDSASAGTLICIIKVTRDSFTRTIKTPIKITIFEL